MEYVCSSELCFKFVKLLKIMLSLVAFFKINVSSVCMDAFISFEVLVFWSGECLCLRV